MKKSNISLLMNITAIDIIMAIPAMITTGAPSLMSALFCVDALYATIVSHNEDKGIYLKRLPKFASPRQYVTARTILLLLAFLPKLTIVTFYFVLVVSSIATLSYVALTINANDNSWLRGTNGALGSANLVSFARLPLALIAPHLLYTQSLGDHSNVTALIVLAIAIASDALDGFLARRFDQITKLGKALDPACDKFVLYPSAIVIAIIAAKTTTVSTLAAAAISAIIIRDILVIAWWIHSGRKTANGISAGICDKVRMVFICAWTIAAFIDIAFVNESWILSIRHACLYAAGLMSVISLIVDIKRIETAKTTPV